MSHNFGPELVIPSSYGSPVNGNSMAGNIISNITIMQYLYAGSYSFNWTGTSPIGTIAVQASNDYKPGPAGGGLPQAPGTWDALTLNYMGAAVQSIPVSGNTGQGIIDITATGIYAIRFVYTATSGTGSLFVTFNGKES